MPYYAGFSVRGRSVKGSTGLKSWIHTCSVFVEKRIDHQSLLKTPPDT